MAETEVDILGEAIAETEKEVFSDAMTGEADDELDSDTALEEMEDPTGFSKEPGADADEDADSDDDQEPLPQAAKGQEAQSREPPAKSQPAAPPASDRGEATDRQERGQVPAFRLREEADKRRLAEANEAAAQARYAEINARLEAQQRVLDDIARRMAPQQQPQAQQPQRPPDMFADPDAYTAFMDQRSEQRFAILNQELQRSRLETSIAVAQARYGNEYAEADAALGKLDPQRDPTANAVMNQIRQSANPAEAMMSWYRQHKTLQEVGPDPAAYRQRLRDEIAKDPEFRKQLLSEMRSEAQSNQRQGRTSNIIRHPPSLNSASGGQSAREPDPTLYDDSERSVLDYAFAR